MKVIICITVTLAVAGMSQRGATEGIPGPRVPVLVELFTSEGCSSCPPADDFIARLQREQPSDGVLIIPLSEHVDYWDGPGWKDPFSSSVFTARQGAYVRGLHLNGPYTPQMVVDGQSEFVGSDESTALGSIASAAERRKAKVEITSRYSADNVLLIDMKVKDLSHIGAEGTNEAYVVVAENNLSSRVRGGENGGRRLAHTAVVRMLQRLGSATPGTPYAGQVNMKLDPSWKKKDLTVVGFIQSPKSRRIVGVGLSTPERLGTQ